LRDLSLLDRILDASVFFSFDRAGYERHAARFRAADLEVDLQGRRIAVTGANSGIGEATATELARRGAHVLLLCRSPERGAAAEARIAQASGGGSVELVVVDMSELASVREASAALRGAPLHGLVHNAGVLPKERTITSEGNELTLATHILGPLALTHGLLSELRQVRGRVVVVTSGGMYPNRLSPRDLQSEEGSFDGVKAYSRTKRGQVVMTELLAEKLPGVIVHAMHPGWADTPAVASSIPGFHGVMEKRLRTPAQGADTVVWLAAAEEPARSTGRLWFDRRAVGTHYVPGTKVSTGTRREWFEAVCALAATPF
jgi:dehydrogenase/reductase SDR family protein 12